MDFLETFNILQLCFSYINLIKWDAFNFKQHWNFGSSFFQWFCMISGWISQKYNAYSQHDFNLNLIVSIERIVISSKWYANVIHDLIFFWTTFTFKRKHRTCPNIISRNNINKWKKNSSFSLLLTLELKQTKIWSEIPTDSVRKFSSLKNDSVRLSKKWYGYDNEISRWYSTTNENRIEINLALKFTILVWISVANG